MTIILSAVPELIRLLHGNVLGLPKIIKEFKEYWRVKQQRAQPDIEGAEIAENTSQSNALKGSLTEKGTERKGECGPVWVMELLVSIVIKCHETG